ncbi:MAG: insulinase family protein, partial [Clostridia bacterium]|nr:insulinase family protein [Clostridia bacterium]
IFSCTDKFDESFEILLDFVQSPYFTEETVQKEQGIIGQEIRMYEDEPSWRVFFNLLLSLYHNHPVRLDIAGTQESIAEITADVLYKCYNSFYHPSNMVIAVVGNITPEQVYRVADSVLKPVEPKELECRLPDEPREVVRAFTEQKMDVGMPIFQLGFKDAPEHFDEAATVQSDILLEAMFGKFTPFYRRLFDAGLINNSFGTEYFQLRGAQATIIAGESNDPERVRDEIIAEIDRVRREGLSREMFECAHRSIYGSYVRMTQSASSLGRNLADCHFAGHDLFAIIEAAACVQYDDVVRLLENRLNPVYHALSVVR